MRSKWIASLLLGAAFALGASAGCGGDPGGPTDLAKLPPPSTGSDREGQGHAADRAAPEVRRTVEVARGPRKYPRPALREPARRADAVVRCCAYSPRTAAHPRDAMINIATFLSWHKAFPVS